MVKSMFSGIAGLRAHQQKMDVIGNNIANVNTFGYKAGRVTFKESIYQTTASSSDGSDVFAGSNPSQIGYGSQVGTIDLMFSNGAYAPTDSAMDCMIDGQGFFMVGPKGVEIELSDDDAVVSKEMSKVTLSRVGNFTFDGDGYLCDGSGNVVYGFGYKDGVIEVGRLQSIRVPVDADGIPLKLNSVSISKTGEIIGNDSAGKSISVGMIGLANVPNPNALEKTQGPYYQVRENTGIVLPFKPGEGTTGKIISYGLEMSNVDLAKEFSEMITTQRGFQANTRIISVTDEMLQELVNIKR
ncbi:flagellar hook-basal body complex protein [Anaerotignum sp. MB30-C6]|uniref:flagellar hook-basal body complex protein n=1 Tax=Anaerotignum sp. MB30-C6 TaxID=3070814 RepID=UPI0027DE726E|nr:flagellar hook-basal body complex protein [Anaerotignum sp. MB30-C6]WMI80981.1 flagellar hook-basal body complex protein [Anaerotignum sp. MB30-C6]